MRRPPGERHAPGVWFYAGLLLLGWLLVTQAEVALAEEPQAEPPTTAAVGHLHSADRLLRLGMTEFAVEHLLEIDPASLPDQQLSFYASLMARAAEALSFIDRAFQERIQANLENDRLRSLADSWYARAVVLFEEERIADALDAWNQSLQREPSRDRRLTTLGRAIARIARVDRDQIQYDPRVQDGALRSFVETWAKKTDLGTEPKIAQVLMAMEQWLDPEGPEAQFWADRHLTVTEASPAALYRRGTLERQRGRPDKALPWLLWAAYTDSLRSDLSPQSWASLASVYRGIGWCDRATEAFGLSLSRGEAPGCAQTTVGSARSEECRFWHDQLLGYSPERLVIRWRGDWQSSFPDLGIWKSRCDWGEPDPFEALRYAGSCRRSPRPLPSLAAYRLGHDWSAERLLCTLEQTTLQTKALARHFRETDHAARTRGLSPTAESAYWRAWALYTLRQGDLERAVAFFENAIELGPIGGPRGYQLFDLLRELRASLAARDNHLAIRLLERLESMSESEGRSMPFVRSLNLAAGWRHVAPRSEKTRAWSDQALIDSSRQAPGPSLAAAWAGRAQVELDRGRTAAALPYLLWAHQEIEAQRPTGLDTAAERGALERIVQPLAAIYSRLQWWDLARELALANAPELPELSALEPEDLLQSSLPDRCRSLHSELSKAGAGGAIRAAGSQWRQRVPELAEWQSSCATARPETAGAADTGERGSTPPP